VSKLVKKKIGKKRFILRLAGNSITERADKK